MSYRSQFDEATRRGLFDALLQLGAAPRRLPAIEDVSVQRVGKLVALGNGPVRQPCLR
jgi:hypothetical protein